MKKLLTFFAFSLVSASLHASHERPASAKAIASPNGDCFLLVVPTDGNESWLWTAYSMGDKGAFKELWSSAGPYAENIYLDDDGRHVVCVVPLLTGPSPRTSNVIGVYDEGKLIKTYCIPDLVKDPKYLRHIGGGIRWLADWPPSFAYSGTLFLRTCDGESYELGMVSGKLTPSFRPPRSSLQENE